MTANPFADPDIDGAKKEMSELPSTFLTTQDLINRHVIIVPKSIEWKQGDRDKYESITADVIVLDGRKTEKIPNLPHVERNKFLGGRFLIAELRKYVPGSGKPEAGQPVVGCLVMDGKSYGLEKADPDVRDGIALKAWEQYSNPTVIGQTQEPPF
jgi:hypothetical protein